MEMMNNIYNTIQEIIYGEIAFCIVYFLVLTVFSLKNISPKKTKLNYLIGTIQPIIMLFGIPYLAITYSMTTTLIIVCTLAIFLPIGLFLPFKDQCIICGNVATRTLVNNHTKEFKHLCDKHTWKY